MAVREKQLTFDARGHQLTNSNVWTPDSQWLVYDVRPQGSSFTGLTIERVNIDSAETEVIYCAQQGAHVGVVTVSPDEPARYVFIHGPENPDSEWHYDFHHRRGVIVSEPDRELAITLDAMDISPPYTAGALRGGTHVHMFSPDGSRLSFTYNDHVMHVLDPARDQRNVGVAIPLRSVTSGKKHPREYDGSHFCVLVTVTTLQPQPGSNQISRAYEESWVGLRGYQRSDGRHQRWALAFIGDTVSVSGEKVAEVFIVDLPENDRDYDRAGDYPLAGSESRLPSPPLGVEQRRLTFTGDRRYPGLVSQPRHWLRSSPDGSAIAFLMKDNEGIVQLWTISPQGGEPQQITKSHESVQSAFSWHPDGKKLALICDNRIMLCDAVSGKMTPLTQRTEIPPSGDAVVFSPNGRHIAYMRQVDGYSQIFTLKL
ncbi:DUF3748 domain-containing protein [Edaphovirga cremea]|uniref:DUF3748 domain-containing protein n=1 Tax=Edaphovirga cremea TaxID=2267246 RepID=UPI0039898099